MHFKYNFCHDLEKAVLKYSSLHFIKTDHTYVNEENYQRFMIDLKTQKLC